MMKKSAYQLLLLAGASFGLAACAPVHYQYCDLNCWHKPKPAPVKLVVPPPPPPAKIIAPVENFVLQSKPVTIRGVNFTTNSSKLMTADIAVLDNAARFALKHPTAILLVKGYCSKTGSYKYNLGLSQERAASVAHYLMGQGVPNYRVITKGYSWEDPVASNATREGRFLNQRVVIDTSIKVMKSVP